MAANIAKLVTVFITVPSKDVGMNISRSIVSEKLAACVNIIPAITSIYEWKGKLEESNELLMIVKTTNERIPELEKRIHTLHPYDVPEFIVVPIAHSAPKYASWIEEQTILKAEL